ncbi:MAG TPA: DUF4783 domain-containing protein [Bacteroidota bacterium]|nr:DUF4783 domain-containing protein [Bacteroidota bacterium]
MKRFVVPILVAILVVPACFHWAGVQHVSAKTPTARQDTPAVGSPPVKEIEDAILQEDAKAIARYFDKQVYLSLQNNEGSYYSSNQALYVLQNYFSSHHVVSFKFTSSSTTGATSYATGGGKVRVKGNRTSVQMYISLSRSGDRWVISQFNVY